MVFAHFKVRPSLIHSLLLALHGFFDFLDLFMGPDEFSGSECIGVSVLSSAVSEDVIDRFNAVFGYFDEPIFGGDRSPWNSLTGHYVCPSSLSCVRSRLVDHGLRPPCPRALHDLELHNYRFLVIKHMRSCIA